MRKVLLILSSTLVDQSLRRYFGDIPSALIPIKRRVSLDYIYEAAQEVYDEIFITVYENKELIIDYINNKNYRIECIELDVIKDIGYSIQSFFSKQHTFLQQEKVNLTIIFADTYIKDIAFNDIINENSIMYAITTDSIRWTTFEKNENNSIVIYDKKDTNVNKEFHNSFIGIFNFADCSLLERCLSNKNNDEHIDSFYNAILVYYATKEIKFIKVLDWKDLGHFDNYLQVKNNLKTRCFNYIDVNLQKGTLIKKSENQQKLIKEIEWYLKLPKDLEYFMPRIFNFSLEYDNVFVKMEYYAYPTLHEMFIYGKYSTDFWKKVIKTLFEVNNEFSKHVLAINDTEKRKALENIYFNKTIKRLEEVRNNILFQNFFSNNFYINNKKYKPLDYIMNYLEEWILEMKLYDLQTFNIIHGDYFFANILFEPNTNIVRLIDPRGDFGGFGIYGDNRYEMAKLSHSIEGKYDFIVEDLFSLNEFENKITYKINSSSQHDNIKKIFYELLSHTENTKQIRFIQSLLFLSMIPLHKDSISRQKVMMCVGVEILNDVLEGDLEC